MIVVIQPKPGEKIHGYDCDCCRGPDGLPQKDTMIEVMQAVGDALDKVPEVEYEICSDDAGRLVLETGRANSISTDWWLELMNAADVLARSADERGEVPTVREGDLRRLRKALEKP